MQLYQIPKNIFCGFLRDLLFIEIARKLQLILNIILEMFIARLNQGVILKKIVDSIKELVQNVNIDAGPTAISLQAMDPSHVALVSLTLKESGFQEYRSDGVMTLGMSIQSMAKLLRLASNDDIITLKAEE